jgi:hypothetical protein
MLFLLLNKNAVCKLQHQGSKCFTQVVTEQLFCEVILYILGKKKERHTPVFTCNCMLVRMHSHMKKKC